MDLVFTNITALKTGDSKMLIMPLVVAPEEYNTPVASPSNPEQLQWLDQFIVKDSVSAGKTRTIPGGFQSIVKHSYRIEQGATLRIQDGGALVIS